MKKIKISVTDQDLTRLKTILLKLDFIKSAKEKQFNIAAPAETIWLSSLSELSLAEEWKPKEDSRYEKYFTGCVMHILPVIQLKHRYMKTYFSTLFF